MKVEVRKVPRDKNVQKAIQGEISLRTRSVPSKARYTRKIKHKKLDY